MTVLKIAGAVERAIVRIGEAVAWLTFLMAVVTCLVALLRYGFALGWIWLQETITWMHAAVFLLAAGYTLARDEHVRVDIFYREMSPRSARRWWTCRVACCSCCRCPRAWCSAASNTWKPPGAFKRFRVRPAG